MRRAGVVSAGMGRRFGYGQRMRSWLMLKIVAAVGLLAWLTPIIANGIAAGGIPVGQILATIMMLVVIGIPYLLALVIAWLKREFAGAILVAAIIALAAQLGVQITLLLSPPDGQSGFIGLFLVLAQAIAVLIGAAVGEAGAVRRKEKAEREMSDMFR